MSLIEGMHKELDRNRELLQAYQQIGMSGVFGATIIKAKIKEAEKTIAEGNVVGMLVAYKDLQNTE